MSWWNQISPLLAPWKFFSPTPWKNPLFPQPLENPSDTLAGMCCAVSLLRLSRLNRNVNNCCEWYIISFSWTFPSKNPVCAKKFAVNDFVVTSWRDVECMIRHERVVGKELHACASGVKWTNNRVIMGVISIVAYYHIESFARLFVVSDSSSCIRLNCNLVGQLFTKRQKSKMFSMQ